MAFAFQQVVISGTQPGAEGNSAAIDAITAAMVTMGWSIYDDRTDQAGTGMRMVLYNNQGEEATASGIYLVLGSGNNQDYLYVSVGTEWDASAHDWAGSAVAAPNTNIPQTDSGKVIYTDRDGDFVLWIGGDKDAIYVVSKNSGAGRHNAYSDIVVGRAIPFLDVDLEPYGVYIFASTSSSPLISNTSSVNGIVGNPPQLLANNQAELLNHYSLSFSEEVMPWRNQGSSTDFQYSLIPVIFTSKYPGETAQGAIGLLKHAWNTAESDAGGLFNEQVLIEPATGREYFMLVSTFSMAFRKS